jgi:hypothetical protein
MEKKDIYEHLAKIYLDSSAAVKKKKNRSRLQEIQNIILMVVAVILLVSLAVFSFTFRHKLLPPPEVALELTHDTIRLNYNFDPAKKEIYFFDLNKSNLANYKAIGFSLKKANSGDNISLKVEFSNAYKEKSEAYIKDIPNKWQDYKMKLSEFKTITDWTEISRLSFIIEEWNTQDKKGVIYLDNVRLMK